MRANDNPPSEESRPMKLVSLGDMDEFPDVDSLLTSLPIGTRCYERWIARASATEIVAALRWLAGEIQRNSWTSITTGLTRLIKDINERIRIRDDADFIRIYSEAGEPPPDFVWKGGIKAKCHSPVLHRGRVSRRQRRAGASVSRNIQGFGHHAAVELALQDKAGQDNSHQRKYRNERSSPEIVFAESYGATQLFSIAEAEEIYLCREAKYGRENKDYVESVIRKMLKKGNRRALAKAPSQDAIDRLRREFPNAEHAADQVERAAALSRLTDNGFFQMPPLLMWGDPGVGKTAFMQALARCLGVPSRRFDIGALSMGGQLFGLSLGWSTGRVGDMFNLLIESLYLNPVVLLDEVEKAGGNSNAPVIPGLLALLEKETSGSYRDEAIDLGLNASHVIWCAAGNDSQLMSRALRSRFIETTIERPEGEDAVRVANSIYRSLRAASPWGKLFPAELDRSIALALANYTPRGMSQRLTEAFGEAAVQGRTHLRISDFPAPPKSRRRMGFL